MILKHLVRNMEYHKYKDGFLVLEQKFRSTPVIEVDKYLSDLLDIGKRKELLQQRQTKIIDRQQRKMWANLDKIAKNLEC